MKHLKTFFAAAAAIIVAVSCNKNTDNDFQYPDYYSFVSAEVDGNNVVRFTTDDGRISSDKMDAWIYTAQSRIPLLMEGKLPVGKVRALYSGRL